MGNKYKTNSVHIYLLGVEPGVWVSWSTLRREAGLSPREGLSQLNDLIRDGVVEESEDQDGLTVVRIKT